MPKRLRFGIPSLDSLFGEGGQETASPSISEPDRWPGLNIPGGGEQGALRSSLSICISGPDGTGKSLLGLHLAATYLADCYQKHCRPFIAQKKSTAKTAKQGEQQRPKLPKIIYVSTDLKFKMAQKMWRGFGLDRPSLRHLPFYDWPQTAPAEDSCQRLPDAVRLELQAAPLARLRPCLPLDNNHSQSASKTKPAGPAANSQEPTAETSDKATKETEQFKPLATYLSDSATKMDYEGEVLFVDLATATAGDDWGFVNRVLALLEPRKPDEPCHLLILDSVEGFEMLVGERDAFGEVQLRRARIAQIMRTAADKCHTLFIVEEPEENKRLPEEFVTDVVIRLRSVMVKDYVRRTLEIEKARGHAHVRGQHAYLIRSGAGSTTGLQENYDDPQLPACPPHLRASSFNAQTGAPYQSYFHVCRSLHYLNREIMGTEGKGRPAILPDRFAAFGIRYLDDMLDGNKDAFRRRKGNDERGLRCSTTTALIGNADTKKSPLGVAFLSRCFRSYAERLQKQIADLKDKPQQVEEILKKADEEIRKASEQAFQPKADWLKTCSPEMLNKTTDKDLERQWLEKALPYLPRALRHKANVQQRLQDALTVPLQASSKPPDLPAELLFLAKLTEADARKPYGSYLERKDYRKKQTDQELVEKDCHKKQTDQELVEAALKEGQLKEIAKAVRAAAWELGAPNPEEDGIPILLTTQDVHAQKLAHDFMPWLLRKVYALKQLDVEQPGALAALRILMEEYSICRRLEIHDLPSAVLIHMVEQAVKAGQRILYGDKLAVETERRFNQSWGIRVVVDDFSIIKNTYIEIREEPLLLRFLIFYLGREGVTTLLIDTQSGRPDTIVANVLDNELRSLVEHRLYTWRFSFYGENRVAIAAFPPISPHAPAIIRELRQGDLSSTGPDDTPLVVDPHFEFYSGIEQGEPAPIPLEIRLFEETAAFKRYIEQEEAYYREWFTPLAPKVPGEQPRVIAGVPADKYDWLRDLSYLQRDTRLNHTQIFQVDEFWEMPRPHLRRAGAYHPQWRYLTIPTTVKSVEQPEKPSPSASAQAASTTMSSLESKREAGSRHEWAVDLFRLFQETRWGKAHQPATKTTPTQESPAPAPNAGDLAAEAVADAENKAGWGRRRQQFNWDGYEQWDEKAGTGKKVDQQYVDRVPLMWDFGFLLCKVRPWQLNAGLELRFWNNAQLSNPDEDQRALFRTVGDVWKRMPKATRAAAEPGAATLERPSWRVFLEACYQIAKAQAHATALTVPALDIHVIASQTLACLVLEIWASEIYQDDKKRREFLTPIAHRSWKHQDNGLIEWLKSCQAELFKTWLLLIEVLDTQALSAASRNGAERLHKPSEAAITTRHWYKTACDFTEKLSPADPVVPVGLPGRFSIRGDWFLAVAGGSRSVRLADRALDLLNSRRANHERLHYGLGLPVRRLVQDSMLTNITCLDRDFEVPFARAGLTGDLAVSQLPRVRKLPYRSLLKIGASRDGEALLHATASAPELAQFNWFWRSSLAHYHRHARIWQEWLGQMAAWWERMRQVSRDEWVNGFERYDKLTGKAVTHKEWQRLKAWKKFQERCQRLIENLEDATLERFD